MSQYGGERFLSRVKSEREEGEPWLQAIQRVAAKIK